MKYFTNVSSFDELKKPCRRLAMQYHPGKGGNPRELKEALKAADVVGVIIKKLWY